MPRKRKIAVKSNKIDQKLYDDRKEIFKLLFEVQSNEAYHKKYAKQLQQLYEKMEHDDFTSTFIVCLKQLMQGDFSQFNNTGLKFMAEFVSSFQAEDMHPLFDSLFQWIFKTVSLTPNVRLRLCEFVNLMLNSLPEDGDIDEFQCNEILLYMFARLKDISPHVRAQAIKALCRLQIIEDPTDEVTQIFLFHLEYDPSPLVRQAVISSIARSAYTVPFIMERLWDVDAKVRRSVLVQMSNFTFSKCTVEQRLTLLEQGLCDCSENVRSIAVKIMLPQWMASCDNNFISFLSNLKLDRNETEMSRFRSVARISLLAMFRSCDPCNLIDVLPLSETSDDGKGSNDFCRCVQLDKLTPELSVFWVTLIEFFQSDDSKCEFLERILPDPTTFCCYIAAFSRQIKMDRSDNPPSTQSISLSLIEVLGKLDLIDETGRESVKNVVAYLLVQCSCDDYLTKDLITVCEKVIPSSSSRLQFYVDMVKSMIHPIDVETSLRSCPSDPNADVQVASLTTKLAKLKVKQTNWQERNECDVLAAIQKEISSVEQHLIFLIRPSFHRKAPEILSTRILPENCLRALKFLFYGVCSKTVKHLIPSMQQLYEDVIRVRLDSENVEIRNWALKCTATFSLLCRKFARSAYHSFCQELYCHQVKIIWVTSIGAIFQLINRYGLHYLTNNRSTNGLPATDSSLNSTSIASVDNVNDVPRTEYVSGSDILLLFERHLDSSHDVDITCELVEGFCMLILCGGHFDEKLMSKLIIMLFHADTEPKLIQTLGIFFETLIRQKKQKCLQLSLVETLTAIANDKTLPENTLRSVLKFYVHSMSNETMEDDTVGNAHTALAVTLLAWMDRHSADHKSLNVTAKEMLLLRVSTDPESMVNLTTLLNNLLLQKSLHKETTKNLKLFQQMIMQPEGGLQFSSTQPADGVEDDGSGVSIEDGNFGDVNDNYVDIENKAMNDENSSNNAPIIVLLGGKEKGNEIVKVFSPKRLRERMPLVEL